MFTAVNYHSAALPNFLVVGMKCEKSKKKTKKEIVLNAFSHYGRRIFSCTVFLIKYISIYFYATKDILKRLVLREILEAFLV